MHKEPILEPIAREIRFRKTTKIIKKYKKPIIIVDLGCGPLAPFFDYLKKQKIKIKSYIGIDPLVSVRDKREKEVKLIKKPVNKKIPLKSNLADFVVAHAVLEHLDNPQEMLEEMIRITKNKGKVIITTPTPISKSILEFLAYKLYLISSREIREHKNYFSKNKLLFLLKNTKGIKVKHQYFEFGLNNLLEIMKYAK
jgi:ubiquinone/menaquinone biosynthesis C-methylase UbiE